MNFSWNCLFLNVPCYEQCFINNEEKVISKAFIAYCMLKQFQNCGPGGLKRTHIEALLKVIEDEVTHLLEFQVTVSIGIILSLIQNRTSGIALKRRLKTKSQWYTLFFNTNYSLA